MSELKSIKNAMFLGYALQSYAYTKYKYRLIPTFLNQAVVTNKNFNPTFLIFRVVNQDADVIAYITFRSRLVKRDTIEDPSFSSVAVYEVKPFNIENPHYKSHIADYEDTFDGVEAICKSVTQVIEGLEKAIKSS